MTVSEISVQGAISDDISGCRECIPRCKFCNSNLVLNIYSTFDGGKNRLSAEWLWKLSP